MIMTILYSPLCSSFLTGHVYTILSSTVQDGMSPLYVASECGHTEIVDLLLGAGADVHQATTKVYIHVADMLS